MFILIRLIEQQQAAFQQIQESHVKQLQQVHEANLKQTEMFRQTMAAVTENLTKLSQILQGDKEADQSSNLASGSNAKERKDIASLIATFEKPTADFTCD